MYPNFEWNLYFIIISLISLSETCMVKRINCYQIILSIVYVVSTFSVNIDISRL